jgi:hypothetical protein
MIHDVHPHARRIYLRGKRHDIYCLVDVIDFAWAMQWAWRYKMDKRGKKFYAVRHGRRFTRGPVPEYVQCDFYMHKQILKHRMMKRPRTKAHRIGDHDDGNSLNNCRINLAWATASKNCKTCKVKTARGVGGRFVPTEARVPN